MAIDRRLLFRILAALFIGGLFTTLGILVGKSEQEEWWAERRRKRRESSK